MIRWIAAAWAVVLVCSPLLARAEDVPQAWVTTLQAIEESATKCAGAHRTLGESPVIDPAAKTEDTKEAALTKLTDAKRNLEKYATSKASVGECDLSGESASVKKLKDTWSQVSNKEYKASEAAGKAEQLKALADAKGTLDSTAGVHKKAAERFAKIALDAKTLLSELQSSALR